MSEKITILSVEDGKMVADRIVGMLKGRIFDVVNCHSAFNKNVTVLEEVWVGLGPVVVTDTLVKIPLYPRRCLCFDIKESPVVVFESDRQIVISRKLSAKDTLVKIVLIN